MLASHDLSGDGARGALEAATIVAQHQGAPCGGSARASDVRAAQGFDPDRGGQASRCQRPLGAQVANEMGRVSLRTTLPLFFDEYRRSRETGSFILIDEATNSTVGAGMILGETM